MEMLEQKAKGEEIVTQPPIAEKPHRVINLMAALEASLAEAKKQKRRTATRTPPPSRGDGRRRDLAVSLWRDILPSTSFKLGRHTLNLSNLDKVLYPETGFTKGDVVHYYLKIAPIVLPQLRDRAITLKHIRTASKASFFTRSVARCTGRNG